MEEKINVCGYEFEKDEAEILKLLAERLDIGRKKYGEWNINDNRIYESETLMEIIDALHYCAANLLKLTRKKNNVEIPK